MDIMLERIKELIGDKHGATKELADAIGVSGNLISDWKAGRAKSYPRYASKIAAHYGVSLDWLCGISDEKEQKKDAPQLSEASEEYDWEELKRIYFELAPERKRVLLDAARGLSQRK